MTSNTRALNRLNRRIEKLLPGVGKAFRAYAIKIGAGTTPNGWADCGDGEAEGFAACFDGLIPEFVSCCSREFGQPPEAIWVLNRIKDAVTLESDIGRPGRKRTVRFPTTPFMPSELFRRQGFRDAMLARISSHFSQPEAESIKPEPTIGPSEARSPADYPQAGRVAQATLAPTGGGDMSGACAFRRQEDVWSLMFNGKRVMLRHSLGFIYIVELLRSPQKEIEAIALASPTAYAAVGMTQILSGGIEMADEQTIQQVQSILNEKRAQLSSLTNDKNWSLKGELKEEIEKLEKYLKEAQRSESVLRKTGGTMGRARIAVTNAIRRAFRKIRTVHPELAAHLEQSIRTGSTLIYTPQELPDWEF